MNEWGGGGGGLIQANEGNALKVNTCIIPRPGLDGGFIQGAVGSARSDGIRDRIVSSGCHLWRWRYSAVISQPRVRSAYIERGHRQGGFTGINRAVSRPSGMRRIVRRKS